MVWEFLSELAAGIPFMAIATFTLSRGKHSLNCTNTTWRFVLDLAERYGWEPAGTVAPDDPSDDEDDAVDELWPGYYDSCDGQTVTAADAKALGRALAAALADPKLEKTAAKLEAEYRQGVLERCGPELAAVYHCGLGDETEYRPWFEELIQFCRGGAFRID